MNHFERVFNFGKKGAEAEKKTPAEALRELYDTNDEVTLLVDSYVKKQEQILMFNDVTSEDGELLTRAETGLLKALADQGVPVTNETLEEFLKTL